MKCRAPVELRNQLRAVVVSVESHGRVFDNHAQRHAIEPRSLPRPHAPPRPLSNVPNPQPPPPHTHSRPPRRSSRHQHQRISSGSRAAPTRIQSAAAAASSFEPRTDTHSSRLDCVTAASERCQRLRALTDRA